MHTRDLAAERRSQRTNQRWIDDTVDWNLQHQAHQGLDGDQDGAHRVDIRLQQGQVADPSAIRLSNGKVKIFAFVADEGVLSATSTNSKGTTSRSA